MPSALAMPYGVEAEHHQALQIDKPQICFAGMRAELVNV